MEGEDPTAPTRQEGDGAPTRSEPATPPQAGREDRLAHGTVVGRYVIDKVLGAGGMGVVYVALDPELGRKVAIKLLQARPGEAGSGGHPWLMREAQAMARLAHPNVITVHDVGAMSDDRVFVAMEFVEGVTLRAWSRAQLERSWHEVVAVMRAAGAGLAAAHAAGLVHRDFKPDNVIVGDDGRVRVMDFGLARLQRADEPTPHTADVHVESTSPLSDNLTAPGRVHGTPAYMAPEIYRGVSADARTDQFAFGVALYEALYRVRPFDRRDLVAGRAVPPTPPADAKVPPWLARVVLRAIALDRDQRFPTMDALLAALTADPTARRRRIAIGLAIALACGGAVTTALLVGGGAADQRCTGAAARLTGVWDAPARTALAAAFRKLGKPFVDDAIAGTAKTLDAYATAWTAMHTDACKATRVRGEQSEAVLTLRMACLDNRLAELGALVRLFTAADEPVVLGAVATAQKLSPIAECADTAALLAPDPLPKDPAARDAVVKLQGKLAEARALKNASKLQDVLAITTAIGADVQRLGHKPTEAELHLIAGEVLWGLDGPDQGEAELQQAVYAAEAGKADETKVEAWLALTNLAASQARFAVATDRWQQTSAALARLGTSWNLQVRVLASKALIASRQNDYDTAIASAKQARELAEQHADAPTQSYALLVEASILNATAHPQDAIGDFAKILAYEDGLGHRRVEVAVVLQNMATAELQLGKFADAIDHIRTSLVIEEAIYGADSSEVARALGSLGAAQSMNGDYTGALATEQKALDQTGRTVGTDSDQYGQILGQIADTLVHLDRPRDAIDYLDRGIAIQTAKLGAGHVQTLTIVLTKCDALHASGDLPGAIAVCEQALATAESTLGKDNPILFVFLGHLGEILLDAGKTEQAGATLDRALQLGATDPSDMYFIAMLDARAQWDLGNRPRAVDLATKARDGFASLGEAKADQAKEAAEWLAAHPLR